MSSGLFVSGESMPAHQVLWLLTSILALLSGGCGAPPPIPTTGLQLWLKADAGVALNGSTVSKWADQSGNGHDAIQLDSLHQPVLVKDGLNGKPTIRFGGLGNRLGLIGSKRMTQISLFIVFKMDSGTFVGHNLIEFRDIDAEGSEWGVNLQTSYTGFSPDIVNIFAGQYGEVRAVAPRCAAFGVWHSISAVTDRVMSTTTVRENGIDAQTTLPHNNLSISVPIGNPTGTGGQIAGPDGTQPPPGRTAAKCDIAEVILYDRVLSDSLRRSVEQYLGMKYQLPPKG